jgi:hypothetical protein
MGFSFIYYELIFVIHVQLSNLFHLGAFVACLTLLPPLTMLDGAPYLVVMGMKSEYQYVSSCKYLRGLLYQFKLSSSISST